MIKETLAVSAICLTLGLPAYAADHSGPNISSRQLAHCMLKKMRASQTESYRDAFKACRDQLDPQRDATTAMNTSAPAPKP
jgi:hypothetical protein